MNNKILHVLRVLNLELQYQLLMLALVICCMNMTGRRAALWASAFLFLIRGLE